MRFIAPVPESVGTNLAGAERFDRAAFHHQMNRRAALDEEVSRIIVTFFKRAFSDGAEN